MVVVVGIGNSVVRVATWFLVRGQLMRSRSAQLLRDRQVNRLRQSVNFFIGQFPFYCFACYCIVKDCVFLFHNLSLSVSVNSYGPCIETSRRGCKAETRK